jgi:hypothetical protein
MHASKVSVKRPFPGVSIIPCLQVKNDIAAILAYLFAHLFVSFQKKDPSVVVITSEKLSMAIEQ